MNRTVKLAYQTNMSIVDQKLIVDGSEKGD